MRAERGFTLAEILVVVLIIGIVTAGMLLSMNFTGQDSELETESKRLLSLMNYTREQSELQTRDYGVLFSEHGYEFVVYDVRRGLWRQVPEDDALRERTLPSGLGFKLIVDARSIVLTDNLDAVDAKLAAVTGSQHSSSDSDASSNSDSNADADSTSGTDAVAPQVMIFSSGDLSSFKITLERPAAGRSISLDENQDGNLVQRKMVQTGDGT